MDNSVKFINNQMGSISEKLDKQTTWLNDSNTSNIIIIGLIIYATIFAGKLWDKGMQFFKLTLVKIIALLLIFYLSKKNVSLAIISAIVLIVIMMKNLQSSNEFLTIDGEEQESDYSNCYCSCNNNSCSCACDNVASVNDTYIDVRDEIFNDNHSAFDKITQQFQEHESELAKYADQI